MQVYNALQLKKGAKVEQNRVGSITQPLQFLPKKKKDAEWAAWNMDWLEWNGIKQLQVNSRRLSKNYKLAKGHIDRNDYIVEEDIETRTIIDNLTQSEDSGSALELKFYPIIPNVINVLVAEFAKRSTKLTYRAVDEFSYNEMLEQKRQMVEQTLMTQAETKILAALLEQGLDPDSEEAQQALNPEQIKSLPEIEGFFKKSYRSMIEEWATHQHKVDVQKFRLDELEERGFRDMLITDREFWHMRMMEDDYEVELWNPLLTFYHKSPDSRYISDSNWVGYTDMITASDTIDKYGYLMTEDQLEALEAIYPIRGAGYALGGYQNDGSFYDASKSHDWNTQRPSLAMRQYTSAMSGSVVEGSDTIQQILSQSEDYGTEGTLDLIRVTTCYWKSQRKLGHLTKVTDSGEVIVEIVTESYKVTDKPIYDNRLFKGKSKDNIIFGEHIEWIWINEVWGGIKIGPNLPSYSGMNNSSGMSPMYIGIDKKTPGPLKFQFKGDNSLYGCKLPVEGSVFSDRNTKSTALVDLMKPFQIGYNIVNNQIADILVDELGTVIMLDQNTLPKHSLGEDWGKGNLAKAYVAMKDFQMLPLDTSITNTENALNFQHFQKLDLDQTNRLMSRIQLSNYFKQQAYEVIGVNPQRMGQQISQQTATGVEQAANASYAQTETYFIQHCDYLMPRVHQMRTDLAQYYHSTNPSTRLTYITSADEKVNFEINGTDLLMRDLNIFTSTTANHRAILDQLKQMAVQNNTTGASIYDLGKIIQSDSIAELNAAMKDSEQKQQQQQQQKQQQEQQMQEQQLQALQQQERMKIDSQAMEKEKDRQKDILIAEIKAAGYGSMVDLNKNQQSDYKDEMDNIRKTEQYQQQTQMQREKQTNDMTKHNQKISIEEQKIQAQRDIANKQLQIAKENKNKYDVKSSKDEKKK
jgi:hypothetical protein|tara:strand:+ start:5344 stop:8103 length:2760 start_codon:yes stop_codon:yes gene_type:complete